MNEIWKKKNQPANTGRVRYPRGDLNKLPLWPSSEAHSFFPILFAKQRHRSPHSHPHAVGRASLALPCLHAARLLSYGSPSPSTVAAKCRPSAGPIATLTASSDRGQARRREEGRRGEGRRIGGFLQQESRISSVDLKSISSFPF